MITMRKTRSDKRNHLPCEVVDCTKNQYARGWCNNHYAKWKRVGTPLGLAGVEKAKKPDCWAGCGREGVVMGLCSAHWQRQHTYGDVMIDKPIKPYKPEGITGYNASHRKIYKERGAAQDHLCVVCQGPARHWALRADADIVIDTFSYETGKKYSVDPYDYDPMCISHHFAYDRAHAGITSTRGVKK